MLAQLAVPLLTPRSWLVACFVTGVTLQAGFGGAAIETGVDLLAALPLNLDTFSSVPALSPV